MNAPTIEDVKRELEKHGVSLVPINREPDALKCAPKWQIIKLKK